MGAILKGVVRGHSVPPAGQSCDNTVIWSAVYDRGGGTHQARTNGTGLMRGAGRSAPALSGSGVQSAVHGCRPHVAATKTNSSGASREAGVAYCSGKRPAAAELLPPYRALGRTAVLPLRVRAGFDMPHGSRRGVLLLRPQ